MERISNETFEAARRAYTLFTLTAASQLSQEIGFGYDAVPVGAPETADACQTEYHECMTSHRAFRVWSGASDHTVFTKPEGNHAWRFWHDVVSHGANGLGFNLADELKAGMQWVSRVAREFGVQSVEAAIAYADTCGQSLFAASQADGQFPEDQLFFVRHYLCIDQVNTMHDVLNSYAPPAHRR